ncbi:MAG: DUF4278 domain-containing protein, partial [Elainella sp.]
MKFKYRGAEYQDQVAVNDPIESTHVAQYRGQTYQMRQGGAVPSQAAAGLSYRGVPYRITETGQTETLSPRERAELKRATPRPVRA